jgi:hypothetical protein
MNLPYQHASSGRRALEDIRKILRNFGVEQVADAEDYRTHQLVISFAHRGNRVKVTASADGWAEAYMRQNPYSSRMKRSQEAYREQCLERGKIAICSMLRDWIKGQVTAVETGLFSFEEAFMGQLVLGNGETVADHMRSQKLIGRQ